MFARLTRLTRLGAGSIVAAILTTGLVAMPASATGFAVDDSNEEWLTVLQNDVLEIDAGYLTLNDQASDPVVTAVSGAQHGTVSLSNGRVRFVPTQGSTADGTFTYTASDGAETATANVTVNVTPSPNCPDLADAFDNDVVVAGTWTRCADTSAHDESTAVGGTWEDGSAALMTTGSATAAEPPVDGDTLGTAWNDSGDSEDHGVARDVSTYKLSIDVPSGQNCVALDYAIGSDEPDEDQPAADGFVVSLDNNNWVRQADFPKFFGDEVVAHPSFEAGDLLNETLTPAPNGTGYAQLLPQRTLTFGLGPGLHALYFSVYDGPLGNNAEAHVDTGVLLDNLRLSHDDEGCPSPVNALPNAVDDEFNAYAGEATQLALARSATDADGDPRRIDGIVTDPTNGTVDCDSTSCDYTPTAGYTGDDELVYRVTDGNGGYDTATITIHVLANPVAAIALVDGGGTSATVEVQRASSSKASGIEVQMLGGDDSNPTTVVDTGTTGADGRATLSWTPPDAGTYFVVFRVSANHDIATDPFPVSYDPDPITSVTVEGPTIAPCNTVTTYTVRATRQSGAPYASGPGGVEIEDLNGGMGTEFGNITFASGVATYEIDPVTNFELCGAELALTFRVGPKSQRIEVRLTNDGIRGLAMIGASRVVTWPGQVNLLGAVSASGIDPSTVPITLTAKPIGAAVPSALITGIHTNSDGLLPVQAVRPDKRTTYQWEATAYAKRSQEWTIDVKPLVSIKAVRGKGSSRKLVLVTGRSTPVAKGAIIRLERRIGSGRWKVVKSTRFAKASTATSVATGATYSFKITRTSKTAQYRVTIPAQSGRLAATSSAKTVR